MGREALACYGTSEVVQLISELNRSAPELAERLFSEALAVATEARDVPLLGLLATLAASESGSFPNLKTKAVESLTAVVRSALMEDASLTARCQIASALSWFADDIPPDLSGTIRATIAGCMDKPETRWITSAWSLPRVNDARTVDELLKAGELTLDPKEKAWFFYAAASKANAAGDFLVAIRALDRVPKDQRISDQWNLIRLTLASRAAVALVARQDIPAMDLVIADTPDYLRPYVQLETALKLADTGNLQTARRLAVDAQNVLDHLDHPDAAAYIQLANCLAQLTPEAVPPALKRVIDLLNDVADSKTPLSPFSSPTKPNEFEPYRLSALFLEVDSGIVTATRRIKDPYVRQRFLLGLLYSALERTSVRPCCELRKD
jgi:hypothetical protein